MLRSGLEWVQFGIQTCLCVVSVAESSENSFPTGEPDSQMDLLPSLLKQSNLTLDLFPNHSDNVAPGQRVRHTADYYSTLTSLEFSPAPYRCLHVNSILVLFSSDRPTDLISGQIPPKPKPYPGDFQFMSGGLKHFWFSFLPSLTRDLHGCG